VVKQTTFSAAGMNAIRQTACKYMHYKHYIKLHGQESLVDNKDFCANSEASHRLLCILVASNYKQAVSEWQNGQKGRLAAEINCKKSGLKSCENINY